MAAAFVGLVLLLALFAFPETAFNREKKPLADPHYVPR